jgi:hypothetical protein
MTKIRPAAILRMPNAGQSEIDDLGLFNLFEYQRDSRFP